MKKYSRKQITEAIAYWKNQLKQLNESIGEFTTCRNAYAAGPTADDRNISGTMTINELLSIAKQTGSSVLLVDVNSTDQDEFKIFGASNDQELISFMQQ